MCIVVHIASIPHMIIVVYEIIIPRTVHDYRLWIRLTDSWKGIRSLSGHSAAIPRIKLWISLNPSTHSPLLLKGVWSSHTIKLSAMAQSVPFQEIATSLFKPIDHTPLPSELSIIIHSLHKLFSMQWGLCITICSMTIA